MHVERGAEPSRHQLRSKRLAVDKGGPNGIDECRTLAHAHQQPEVTIPRVERMSGACKLTTPLRQNSLSRPVPFAPRPMVMPSPT